jgi:hypothetical protein
MASQDLDRIYQNIQEKAENALFQVINSDLPLTVTQSLFNQLFLHRFPTQV